MSALGSRDRPADHGTTLRSRGRAPPDPPPTVRSLVGRPDGDLFAFARAHGATDVRLFGVGKGALRDSLARRADDGETVVLPALVPAGVPATVRSVGLEPTYYPVTERLRADLDAVRERVDDRTVALLAVDYFGFPDPSFDDLAAVAEARDVALVEDASHGALSVADGRLLGTRGDAGFASLHKAFPVRTGALQFGEASDGATDSGGGVLPPGPDDPSPPSRPLLDDAAHAVLTTIRAAACRYPTVDGSVDVARSVVETGQRARRWLPGGGGTKAGDSSRGSDPARSGARPAAVGASPLSRWQLARVDPEPVRSARRRNFLAWADAVRPVDGLRPVFDDLPSGVCPWRFPALAADPDDVLRRSSRAVAGGYTWPPLPDDGAGAVSGTAALAARLVTFPVHQGVDPSDVARAGRELHR